MKELVKKLCLFSCVLITITFIHSSFTTVQAQPKGDLVPVLEWPALEPADDPLRWNTSVLIGETWKKIGIRTRIIPKKMPALWPTLRARTLDFHLFTGGWIGRPERFDPHMLLWTLFHSSLDMPGGTNYQGYSSKEYDEALENQRKEVNLEKRKKYIFQAQEILARDVATISLYWKNSLFVRNNTKFTGYQPLIGSGFFNVTNWTQVRPLTNDKTLKISIERDWDTISPYNVLFAIALPLIYDTLGTLSPDGSVVPWAAKSWQNTDPTTWEITLREGMLWHDGKPVTAEDIKFTIDYNKKWKAPSFTAGLDPIEKVDILDKYKVRIKLKEPFPPITAALFVLVSIMPKHIWENVVEEKGLKRPEEYPNSPPIGSGPFKFVHWRRGEETLLARHDSHFSQPKAEKIMLIPFATDDAAFAAVKKGDADYIERSILPIQYEEAKKLKQLTTVEQLDISFYQVGLNLMKPPFNDINFRRAIAHAIPYKQIVASVLGGKGIIGQAGGVISPALKYWYNPNVPKYDFNLEKSREILKKAGYEWDKQGLLHYPSGKGK